MENLDFLILTGLVTVCFFFFCVALIKGINSGKYGK